MRRAVIIGVVALVAFIASGTAPRASAGEAFPARPIEITVPYTAGTTMDLLARLICSVAPKYLKQPLVAVNKPGAGGSAGREGSRGPSRRAGFLQAQ